MSRACLAQTIGERANKDMSAKVEYTDEPIGNPKLVADVLPRSEDRVFQGEGVKVTNAPSKRSVDFFKIAAQKHNTQYRRMIRRLLDACVEHHPQPQATRSKRTKKTRRVTGALGIHNHE